MAKAKKEAAPKKERSHTYDPKLKVNGSFDQFIAMSVGKDGKKSEKK